MIYVFLYFSVFWYIYYERSVGYGYITFSSKWNWSFLYISTKCNVHMHIICILAEVQCTVYNVHLDVTSCHLRLSNGYVTPLFLLHHNIHQVNDFNTCVYIDFWAIHLWHSDINGVRSFISCFDSILLKETHWKCCAITNEQCYSLWPNMSMFVGFCWCVSYPADIALCAWPVSENPKPYFETLL